jgi:threonine dehydratase
VRESAAPAPRSTSETAQLTRRGALIPLEAIEAARERVADAVLRTPLVRFDGPEVPPETEIWLKLECLQPIGSFKLRGALNAVRLAPAEALAAGVTTTSAGNMAQGVAWAARERGVRATIVVPEHAPATKLAAVERLGGTIVRVSHDEWWQTMLDGRVEGGGLFVHPVLDDDVMAGNGTIGLELVEDLETIDAVVVPWGGGGLFTGIASALAHLNTRTRAYAVQPDGGAALVASVEAGRPVETEHRASFVDGAGAALLLPGMWERARPLLAGAFAVSPDEAASAIRLLSERTRVVAEGAGALALAGALAGRAGTGRVVCIVSGGNIDAPVLAEILAGRTPS